MRAPRETGWDKWQKHGDDRKTWTSSHKETGKAGMVGEQMKRTLCFRQFV